MIQTAMQLKAKLRNLSKASNADVQDLAAVFMLERFLERISASEYSQAFVLKGGMLLASMLGVDTRATADMDVTLTGETMSLERMQEVLQEIAAISLDDNVSFNFHRLQHVMEAHDYPGIQARGTAQIDKTVIPVKLDISTGDIITPGPIEYSYPLMFEDRSLNLLTYNLETVLAEKLIAVAQHGIGNTRMRDYYDIHVLLRVYNERINPQTLADALAATASQRHVEDYTNTIERLLLKMEDNPALQTLWNNYGKGASYARDIAWPDVLYSVGMMLDIADLAQTAPSLTKQTAKPPRPKRNKRSQPER